MIEMRCVITGKVQGVRFRDYVQASATELGLAGWVKNQADGSVLVCAQGLPETLRDMVEYLNEGSLLSEVASVAVEWHSIKKPMTDFSILVQ